MDGVDSRRFLDYSLHGLFAHSGLSNGQGFQHWLDSELGSGNRSAHIERLLHVVATDVLSGAPVILTASTPPSWRWRKRYGRQRASPICTLDILPHKLARIAVPQRRTSGER